jgi:hypothetical protein
MNKPKYQITQRARKKMNKEVRASAIQPNPKPMSNTIKPASLLSRYPKKVQKKEAASLKSLNRNISAKRKKIKSPHSKELLLELLGHKSARQLLKMSISKESDGLKALRAKFKRVKK